MPRPFGRFFAPGAPNMGKIPHPHGNFSHIDARDSARSETPLRRDRGTSVALSEFPMSDPPRRAVSAPPPPSPAPAAAGASLLLRTGLLVWSMLLTVALIAALVVWDAGRQGEATLQDFAQEQATLASSVAMDVQSRLAAARRDALLAADEVLAGRPISTRLRETYVSLSIGPADAAPPAAPERAVALCVPIDARRRIELVVSLDALLADLRLLERTREQVFLIAPPEAFARAEFFGAAGQRLVSEALHRALLTAQGSFVLPRTHAVQIGLPERMALAGLARTPAGLLGTGTEPLRVAAVSTALRERDREYWTRWRAILSVLLAGTLVLAFGGAALYLQRKELNTERALALAHLGRERDERLQRASKAATMGTLALGITHELSTPLGVIAGRTEQLIERLRGDERSLRSLESIQAQTSHIDQIIRGFLGLVRGHHPLTRPVPPGELLRGALALCEHRFAKAGVRLETAVREPLPWVCCDVPLIEHAIVNLLLNACDACEQAPGGGRVEVAVERSDDWVQIEVRDNGTGISPADAERALEPFFTTKSAGEGTGIGLAVAQEIVKNHRGTLSLGPRPQDEGEGGTRATIRIPVWQGDPHAA